MGGFSATFGSTASILRIQGIPLSGLIANSISFFCIYFAERINIRYQFLFYLIVGDIGIIYYYMLKLKIFSEIQKNKFEIELQPKSEILLNFQNVKNQQHEQPSSYVDHLKSNSFCYINTLLYFYSTAAIFPSLMYRLETSSLVSAAYKFTFLSFIFNISDFSGRLLTFVYKPPYWLLYLLLPIKLFTIYIFYYFAYYDIANDQYSIYFKIFWIVFVAFSTGYINSLTMFFAQEKYRDKPLEMKKVGIIFQYIINLGLFSGVFFAFLFFRI